MTGGTRYLSWLVQEGGVRIEEATQGEVVVVEGQGEMSFGDIVTAPLAPSTPNTADANSTGNRNLGQLGSGCGFPNQLKATRPRPTMLIPPVKWYEARAMVKAHKNRVWELRRRPRRYESRPCVVNLSHSLDNSAQVIDKCTFVLQAKQ